MLAIAQASTGKEAAFAIPENDLIHKSKINKHFKGISCFEMVPTLGPAMPIGDVFQTIARHSCVKVLTLISQGHIR